MATTTTTKTARRQCAWWGDTTRCPDYTMPDSDYCETHTRWRMRALGTREARWERYTDEILGPESED